jgi:hypothetical protein
MTDEMENVVAMVRCKSCGRPQTLLGQEYRPSEEPKRYPGAEDLPGFGKVEMQPFNCCGEWQAPSPEAVEYWSKRQIVEWQKQGAA